MEYMLHMFNAGGFVMYPLLVFLIASWMIGIERFRAFNRFRDSMNHLATLILNNQDGSWHALKTEIKDEKERDQLFELMTITVNNDDTQARLEGRINDVVGHVDTALKRGLNWLSMMVTMAPLLGLLGTVLGMIRSFQAIGADANSPMVITGGVSEALIATASGLTVAIVALAFYTYCSARINTYLARLEHVMSMLVDVYVRGEA